MSISGDLQKMETQLNDTVNYRLPLGEQRVAMNDLIGQVLSLQYNNEIHCIACGRKTNKSFNQGYCFPCMRSLPECDSCIVKPELCHFHKGTCRDEQWALSHCMQDHIVYLANSSGIKVGITRVAGTHPLDGSGRHPGAAHLPGEKPLYVGLVGSGFEKPRGGQDGLAQNAERRGAAAGFAKPAR